MGTRADFETVRQQLQKSQVENQDLNRLNAELQKVLSTTKTKAEQTDVLEKKTQTYQIKVQELEKTVSNHLQIAEDLRAQNQSLKHDLDSSKLAWTSKLEESNLIAKEKTGKHLEMLDRLKTTSKSLTAKNLQIKELEQAMTTLKEDFEIRAKKMEAERESLEAASNSFEIEVAELQKQIKELERKLKEYSVNQQEVSASERKLNQSLEEEKKKSF